MSEMKTILNRHTVERGPAFMTKSEARDHFDNSLDAVTNQGVLGLVIMVVGLDKEPNDTIIVDSKILLTRHSAGVVHQMLIGDVVPAVEAVVRGAKNIDLKEGLAS